MLNSTVFNTVYYEDPEDEEYCPERAYKGDGT